MLTFKRPNVDSEMSNVAVLRPDSGETPSVEKTVEKSEKVEKVEPIEKTEKPKPRLAINFANAKK